MRHVSSNSFIIKVEQRQRIGKNKQKCLKAIEKLISIFIVAMIITQVVLAIVAAVDILDEDFNDCIDLIAGRFLK